MNYVRQIGRSLGRVIYPTAEQTGIMRVEKLQNGVVKPPRLAPETENGGDSVELHSTERIYLSAPNVRGPEYVFMQEAIESNWVAPTGPDLMAFEREIAELTGREHAVGLASATAALHLALIVAGVGPGDEVACSTFTFVATANSIHHAGATPVFLDSGPDSWNLDPDLLAAFFEQRAVKGLLPKALITVDLYGQCCDYEAIEALCDRYGVILIEDSAEALGAIRNGRPAGSFGLAAVFSFNGNKILNTSGGGMLVTDDGAFADRVRHLATQARDDAPHYQHTDRGWNYRLSNLLAAFGRGQLVHFDERVGRRRDINRRYRDGFADIRGLTVHEEAEGNFSTHWLTCIRLDQALLATPEQLRLELEQHNIESRPVWKPIHLQPAYAECEAVLNGASDAIFANGLCLPSGDGLSDDDVDRVIWLVQAAVVEEHPGRMAQMPQHL